MPAHGPRAPRRPRSARAEKTIFLHIPKTAGTSFRQVIEKIYPENQRVFVYSHEFLHHKHQKMALREKVDQAEIVYGHLSYGIHRQLGIDAHYVTFVRDPVDRVVSFFRHQAREPEMEYHLAISQGMTLVDLLRSGECHQVSNHMTSILAGRHQFRPKKATATLARACENLDNHFRAVGVAECMDESVAQIANMLGWTMRPVVPRLNVDPGRGVFTLDEETRTEIVRFNSLDIELYERIVHGTRGHLSFHGDSLFPVA
jgi:hypothetical protein